MAKRSRRKSQPRGPHTDEYADRPRTSDVPLIDRRLAANQPVVEAPLTAKKNWFVGRPITNISELPQLTRTLGSKIFRIFEYEGALILPLLPRGVMGGVSYERAVAILGKVQEGAAKTAMSDVDIRTGSVYVTHTDYSAQRRLVSLSLAQPTSEAIDQIRDEIDVARGLADPNGRLRDDTHSIQIAEVRGDEMAATVASITRNLGLEYGVITLDPPKVCQGPSKVSL